MNYNNYEMENVLRNGSMAVSEAFPVLMRKVYVWMTLALVVTGLTAYGVATSPGMVNLILTNSMLFWGLIIAEFALVIGLNAAINKLSLPMATLMFLTYSVVNGATLSVIFLAYTVTSIASVFFITAGTFAVMALIGYTTKTDLTSLVNVFFIKSTGVDLIISCIGVLVFVGLTAHDAQKIKQMLMAAPDAGSGMQKLALLGALSLYLDFINLFLYLLRLFGKRE